MINLNLSNDSNFYLIGGLNVFESIDLTMHTCEHFVKTTNKLKIPYIFKASFDKANRSDINSYRGMNFDDSMKLFEKIKNEFLSPLLIFLKLHKFFE